MKKIIIIALVWLLMIPSVYALQQLVGKLVLSVPIGGTNTIQYGLINDENETISVNLRAEGDVAKYLSFPKTVNLEPHKTVYINITAKIPNDYNLTSLGNNITGYIFALQEGKSDTQVKINIQMRKIVEILVYQPAQPNSSKPITGFFGFPISWNLSAIILVSIIFVFMLLYLVKIKRR